MVFLIFIPILMQKSAVNSADPDQTPRSVAALFAYIQYK